MVLLFGIHRLIYFRPFKFLNLWAECEDFISKITTIRHTPVNGNPIYQFITKLRMVKTELETLHRFNKMELQSSITAFLDSLNINPSKSSLYLSGTDVELQSSITAFLEIQHKALPVKYLGVHLITTRITQTDYIPLVERIISIIKLWTSSSLMQTVSSSSNLPSSQSRCLGPQSATPQKEGGLGLKRLKTLEQGSYHKTYMASLH
ncbi:hypothetical protein NC652_024456 [Populus alba x Populus x berolinensis]|nr:hypothetical protein NC652_024456 [Populus alba x Populus x berolinensis]